MDHVLIVSESFWKTCWAVANILDCRVHWIGTTEMCILIRVNNS